MPTTIAADTLTQAMHKAIRTQLDHPNPDAVLNIESHLYDVTLDALSASYEIDLGKNLWLNRQRWSRLIREYVPREPLERFIAQGREILRGDARKGATANMMFRDPDRYAKKHRWGGCLMGATFRGDSKRDQPTLTFFSRTTYIGYMGLLDAGIGHVMAREICGNPECCRFRWVISSSQLHCFKTLPYIYSQPDLMRRLEGFARLVKVGRRTMPPTWFHMGKWYNKVLEAYATYGVDMLAHEKYGPFRRIKRRWLEYKGYLTKAVPPSVPISTLDFEKAEGASYDPSKETGDDSDE